MTTSSWKKWLTVLIVSTMLVSLTAVFSMGKNNSAKAATTSFRFVVMGDSRGSSDGINESTLRGLMKKVKGLDTQPSFIMFTGDMVEGGSDVGSELADWKKIVDDYYPINTIYPAMGNHEDDETLFSKTFSHLPNEQLDGYKRTAYYFDYGNARFITLNSDRENKSDEYIITQQQRDWLENVLKNSGKTHHFIQFHVPAYPIGSHYGESLDESPADRDAFWDIVDKYNVTAVLVGHEHNYNRREIDSSFNGNGHAFDNQIYQVTIGGGGAPLTGTKKDSRNVIVGPKKAYHYMAVDIADGLATFNVYDNNNNKIDSFKVNRSGGTPIGKSPSTASKSFQNGVYPTSSYAGTHDTSIAQLNPSTNYGDWKTLHSYGDYPAKSGKDVSAIVKWDLTAIPTGRTVKSASVTLNVTNASSDTYELYEMKRNWSESAVTWNSFADGSNWQKAGAKGTDDRGTTLLGTIKASASGKHTIHLNADGIALVQKWINDPSTNYGMIMTDISNSDGLGLTSSESSIAANRPKLTVHYE